MWIRSQNKENLAEANDIDIIDRKNGEVGIYVNCQTYAVYSTKAKALKVLDRIQREVYLTSNDSVYVMPQDDEVEE